MKTIFMNTKNSRNNEPQKFFLNVFEILDLKSSNKHIALQNLSIYYIQKKIQDNSTKNIKLKIIAPTRNDLFELPDGSY